MLPMVVTSPQNRKEINMSGHNKDLWLEVLEGRVKELERKEKAHRTHISEAVNSFREWVAEASEVDIYYDAEFEAKKITSIRETYKAVWAAYKKAESELNAYKETTKAE